MISKYLSSVGQFALIICDNIGAGYRDMTADCGGMKTKIFGKQDLAPLEHIALDNLNGRISISLVLNHDDKPLTFNLVNDFDVGGENENDIFRTAMIKKFGKEYYDELTNYMLEKNCQQVELLTNKTLNKLRALRQFVESENY